MRDSSRECPEPIFSPELDYNLLEVSQKLYESGNCFRLVDDPMELKYPPTPTENTYDPSDPASKFLCYPIFPDETETPNRNTQQKDGK